MNSDGLSDAEHEGSDESSRSLYDERADSVMGDVSAERSYEQAAEEQDESQSNHGKENSF
jgi:hypothetical protein